MATRMEPSLERLLSRDQAKPLARRVEIRKVLNRHHGSKAAVARSVTPRPVSNQAVSQWLAGRTTSRPIWEAADRIAAALLEKEERNG